MTPPRYFAPAVLAAAFVASGCKSDAPEKQAARPAAAGAATAKTKPRRTFDAAGRADKLLAKPLQFATRRPVKPAGVPACPTAGVCIAELDYAYLLMRNSWSHHYVLDWGAPKLGLRKGSPTLEQIDLRLDVAVRALLKQSKERHIHVQCGMAYKLARLLRIGAFVAAKVPANPRAPGKPIVARTPSAANKRIAYVLAGAALRRELFNTADRATMKANTFGDPRVTTMVGRSGTPQKTTEVRVTVVWSPESRRVYILEHTTRATLKELLAGGSLATRRGLAEQALLTALRALGVSTVRVDTRRACELRRLTGYGDWLRARL